MIYFQGTDNSLWRVNPDGVGIVLGGYQTKSTPVVFGDYVYFQGTDDMLWRINRDGSGGIHLGGTADPSGNILVGGYKTSSPPFVTAQYIYFRGTDDVLWRITNTTDGGAQSTAGRKLGDDPSNPFKTRSTPFAYGQFVYFQGTDNQLWRANLDGSGGMNMHGSKTSAAPSVAGGYVYIRGDSDQGLWRMNLDGTGSTRIGPWESNSTYLVTTKFIFFQGKNNELCRMNLDGSNTGTIGGYTTKSMPAADEAAGFLYFQGTDDKLWRMELGGVTAINFGGFQTHGTPCAGPPRVTASPAPIINNQVIALAPLQSHTFDFTLDRLGDLTATVTSSPNVQMHVELFDSAHHLLASDANRITPHFNQRGLHQSGPLLHLTITAPATAPNPVHCTVFAQVYNTLPIAATTIQSRLNAFLGAPGQAGNINFRVSWTDQKKNIVYVKIDETLYFTLDNFSLLDNFETMRATQFDGTVAAPAKVPPLDPNQWYPISTFDPGKEIHNLETGPITVTVGTPGTSNGGPPTVTLTVPLVKDPDGLPTEIKHLGGNVRIVSATFVVLLTMMLDGEGSLTISASASSPDLNLDRNEEAIVFSDAYGSLIGAVQGGANNAFGVLLPKLLTTLMGGTFTIQSIAWVNNGFQLVYIPGVEESPHTITSNYSAHGTTPVRTAPQWSSPNLGKVEHIVVLMMENRSFDHVLGYLSLANGRKDLDGLTPDLLNSFAPDERPAPYTETRLPFDPDHSFGIQPGQPPYGTARQMGNDDLGKGPMRGFVASFLHDNPAMAFAPDSPQRQALDDPYWFEKRKKYTKSAVMGYYTEQTLPFYKYLADQYMVCDRWYSSHPGPTLPNRFFYLMGHLATGPDYKPQVDQGALQLVRGRTIQDALTERGVSWKMYESPPDVCMLRMFARYAFDDVNIRPIAEFMDAARAGSLPQVSFLEPNFHMSEDTNDDHPPCDMANGQKLVQNVYEALTANAEAWNKTLFIITYDEHGGLYDHRLPELADRYVAQANPDTAYGIRVPAFIISPWVPAGSSTHTVFDHTSILKTIVNRFCPNDPAIMSDRMAFANDVLPLLTLATPRTAALQTVSPSNLQASITTSAGAAAPALAAKITVAAVASTTPGPSGVPTKINEVHAAPLPQPAPARMMLADAKSVNAKIPRNKELFAGDVDWHQYMTRLGMMLK